MHPLSSILLGCGLGFLFSIPPGAAGAIILNLSLREAQKSAAHALAGFLVAELVVMAVALLFYAPLAQLAALTWVKPVAGVYLIAFAILAWRAAGNTRGFTATSALAVFRITLLNPAIWIGALSTLTVARTSAGPGVVPAILFIAGVESGSLIWYVGVILGAHHIPSHRRQQVERAAALIIGATGAWFVLSLWTSLH
jgi:threonine/homoserine/homoserine lactone efflux protein